MEKETKEIEEWLEKALTFELPSFKELPSIFLYMEQVVSYINQTLAPLSSSDTDVLTSFMVNNYVKARILQEPDKKRYSKEHLGYLLAITSLKRTLSMSEISLLIEMDKDVSTDKSVLYGFFRVMSTDILHEGAEKAQGKVTSFLERYNKEKTTEPAKADMNLRDSLGLIALRLSIQAEVNQAIANVFLQAIAKSTHSQKEFEIESTPGHKEIESEIRINEVEAKRLALAKREKEKMKKKMSPQKEEAKPEKKK